MHTLNTADVSVIVPCYNCQNTIIRAIESIENQSLRPKEVLLINDCSTDGTINKLHAIQEHFGSNRIKIINHQHNRGPGVARNTGWEAATSQYIAFLDADDSWHPKKIEIQYAWMLQNPTIAMTAHLSTKYEHTSRALSNESIEKAVSEAYKISPQKLLLRNIIPTRSAMLKRTLKNRFAHEKRYSEDYLLWLQIAFSDEQIYFINLPLSYTYKANYGQSGLSSQLWNMESGELNTFRVLRDQKKISSSMYLYAISLSLLKFLKRLLFTEPPKRP